MQDTHAEAKKETVNCISGDNAVDVPQDSVMYMLNGKDGKKRSAVMTLNGRDLVLGENWEMPDMSGKPVKAGNLELPPLSCTFLIV